MADGDAVFPTKAAARRYLQTAPQVIENHMDRINAWRKVEYPKTRSLEEFWSLYGHLQRQPPPPKMKPRGKV